MTISFQFHSASVPSLRPPQWIRGQPPLSLKRLLFSTFLSRPFQSQVSFIYRHLYPKLRLEQIVHWTVRVFSLRYQLRPTKTMFQEILLLNLQQDLARSVVRKHKVPLAGTRSTKILQGIPSGLLPGRSFLPSRQLSWQPLSGAWDTEGLKAVGAVSPVPADLTQRPVWLWTASGPKALWGTSGQRSEEEASSTKAIGTALEKVTQK